MYKFGQHFFIYHSWYISNFESNYKKSPFIKVAIFFWYNFSINLSWLQSGDDKINMIDIIYKTVKPSHLKKIQIIQNINNLMFQIIFIFFEWILIK